MMGKLIADVGPLAGKTLVATHIDSWEDGSQNWTPRMREEFQQRRGYDLLPFLPVMTGRVVGQPGGLRAVPVGPAADDLASWSSRTTPGTCASWPTQHGLRLSIEAYGGPCDDLAYAGRADEPMGEFWIGGGAMETCKGMASAAHVYGKPIVGAEAFTAADQERWLRASRPRSRRWATGRSARASTASSSTATRCSRGLTTAGRA